MKRNMYIMNSAVKRICIDLKELTKNPIENVYYEPDEDNIYIGYVLINGVKDTPYVYGNYLFKFEFPENYPFSPPKVKFCTYDGVTRFNPNLYRSGKVCLSILNTWSGEKWSSCQSLSTVLLNLQITLNENPYLNEPGVRPTQYELDSYNETIMFKNIEVSILKYLDVNKLPEGFKQFHHIIVENFNKNKDFFIDYVKSKKNRTCITGLYTMSTVLNYDNLLQSIMNINIISL